MLAETFKIILKSPKLFSAASRYPRSPQPGHHKAPGYSAALQIPFANFYRRELGVAGPTRWAGTRKTRYNLGEITPITRVFLPQLPNYFRPFYRDEITPFITIAGAHLVGCWKNHPKKKVEKFIRTGLLYVFDFMYLAILLVILFGMVKT